eukprot:TRINITY_DN5077_c0_g1_i4.p1 TRINITY_DN5077_c0_g1~~TRINITY_DN5077_c0_g1_i4.p1  ORF type:complete len:654 (+),score=116.96 TRINITY_DN5077_c0_g1_i4:110-2071(+)
MQVQKIENYLLFEYGEIDAAKFLQLIRAVEPQGAKKPEPKEKSHSSSSHRNYSYGATLEYCEKEYTYLGFICRNEDELEVLLYDKENRTRSFIAWNSNMKIQQENASLPPVDTLETRLMCTLLKDCLSHRTLRGVPLTAWIEKLKADIDGIQIYVVGGAARDFLRGDGKVNDIDFAVNAGYYEIKSCLANVSRDYNTLPAIYDSRIRHKYAMLSIPGIIINGEMEPTIDIGPLKGCLIPKNLWEDNIPYYTACSDISCDAKFRDFTVNAIYIDVINWEVIDPLGGLGLQSANKSIILKSCWDAPLYPGFYDPKVFPMEVLDYRDIGGWMRGLRFSTDRRYTVACYSDIVEKLTNYVKDLIKKVLKLKDAAAIHKKEISEFEIYFYKLFTKLWKETDNSPPVLHQKIQSLKNNVESQNCLSDWFQCTCRLAFMTKNIAYSESTKMKYVYIREGIHNLSKESMDKSWSLSYQPLVTPAAPVPLGRGRREQDLLTSLRALPWDVEQDCQNRLCSFKEYHQGDYLNQFMKEPPDSAVNLARQSLRDFWNRIMHNPVFFECESLWERTHWFRLLMKARNHLFLVEPYDEAVFVKKKFYLGSDGGYWHSANRPERYDKIEEKLSSLTGGNCRRKILKEIYPDGIPHHLVLSTCFRDSTG